MHMGKGLLLINYINYKGKKVSGYLPLPLVLSGMRSLTAFIFMI